MSLGEPRQTRFMAKAGNGMKFYPTKIWTAGDYYYIESVMAVKDEIKAMKGAHWCGFDKEEPMKLWRVNRCRRNDFAIAYLEGLNPYARYKTPLEDKDGQGFRLRKTRKTNTGEVCEIRDHQIEMILHMLIRRQCIIAGEMGTGKTLAAFEAIELSLVPFVWYIAPRSALNSVRLEARKWELRTNVRFMTYDELKTVLKNWKAGDKPPTFVVCDESSRVKNPTSQRSQAVEYLAEAMRQEYGDKCYIIEMSGSPSPKEPTDWYHQCEIACPGYIREGDLHKFRARLAVQAEQNDIVGYSFKKIVAWRDGRSGICDKCGRPQEHECHDLTPKGDDAGLFGTPREQDKPHAFVPLANEVNNLYKRMAGLTLVKLKKDCFGGDTEVLTQQGPKKIRDLVGMQKLYIKTSKGMEWADCEIKSFGKQQTYHMSFGDGSVCRATANHEWIQTESNVKHKTYQLRLGKTRLPLASISPEAPDMEGYAHGFVFGDGWVAQVNQSTCNVELHDHDNDLAPLLCRYGTPGTNKSKGVYNNIIRQLPKHWKELPKNPTKAYALGFILGLMSADGLIVNSTMSISQADWSVLEQIREWAIYCGLRVNPIRKTRSAQRMVVAGRYANANDCYSLSINTYNIDPEWILRKDQKERLKNRTKSTITTVNFIDWANPIEEEVFCAVVPIYHNFTLANGVITGNCLSLPDKQYRIVKLKPSLDLLRAARIVQSQARTSIQQMTLLRELSDGFQYRDNITKTSDCTFCGGTCFRFIEGVEEQCMMCEAGKSNEVKREVVEVESPKINYLTSELLEENEEIGRLVIYAGFTGSIDRICREVKKHGWEFIRVDGRGWVTSLPGNLSALDMLSEFQNKQSKYEKVAFIGHPGSAGMGLTLTAASMIVYFSNDFNAESRIQSEDRIHRIGMDENRGATIVDLICLPTDLKVLENLRRKRELQSVTLNEISKAMDEYSFDDAILV